jgi:hypothetical protein
VRADPLALFPLSMQTTFNLKSCIYLHLLNLMQYQAQIVAFEANLAAFGKLFIT